MQHTLRGIKPEQALNLPPQVPFQVSTCTRAAGTDFPRNTCRASSGVGHLQDPHNTTENESTEQAREGSGWKGGANITLRRCTEHTWDAPCSCSDNHEVWWCNWRSFCTDPNLCSFQVPVRTRCWAQVCVWGAPHHSTAPAALGLSGSHSTLHRGSEQGWTALIGNSHFWCPKGP